VDSYGKEGLGKLIPASSRGFQLKRVPSRKSRRRQANRKMTRRGVWEKSFALKKYLGKKKKAEGSPGRLLRVVAYLAKRGEKLWGRGGEVPKQHGLNPIY